MNKFTHYLIIAAAASQLTACQTLTESRPERNTTQAERIDAAIENAAISAANKGSASASLLALEKQYKRNPENPSYAIAYSKGLRQAQFLNRAKMVLEPFAKEEPAFAGVQTEMSMIALALGNYNSAENYAQKAVLQDPEDYKAYQNLGIALDAKEMHPEAERAFRKGLEHWQGDPTTIMNNLALNLATQGFIDEAVEVLERAQALSPDRIEIERNLRIIRTLNER